LVSIPITEVIELSKSEPFSNDGSHPVARALGIDRSFSAWSVDGVENLKFSPSNNYFMQESMPWTTIAYRLPETENVETNDNAYSSFELREKFMSAIIALGVQNLLELYGKVLSRERDHLNLGWKKIAPYSRLRRLEKLDLKRADISLTLADVLEFEERNTFYDIPSMTRHDGVTQGQNFREVIVSHLFRQATRLKQFDDNMAELSFRRMVVSSSTESIRLQVIVAIFAASSLVIAYGSQLLDLLKTKSQALGHFLNGILF